MSDGVVVVDRDGATVLVGEREVGVSPLAGPVSVGVGEATVRPRRDGCEVGLLGGRCIAHF